MHKYEKKTNFFITSNIGDIKLYKFQGGGGGPGPPPPSRSAHGPLANDFLSMNSLLYNWCNIYLRYIISVIHVEASTRNVLWFIHSLITRKSVRVGVLGLSNFIYAKKVNIQSLCSTHMHVYIRCIITCIYREGKYIIEFFLKKFRGLWVVKPCPSPLACFRRHTWRTVDVRVGSLSLRFSQIHCLVRRYMAEILLMQRKTPINQSIASEYKYENKYYLDAKNLYAWHRKGGGGGIRRGLFCGK